MAQRCPKVFALFWERSRAVGAPTSGTWRRDVQCVRHMVVFLVNVSAENSHVPVLHQCLYNCCSVTCRPTPIRGKIEQRSMR
jgi:hypothetical protein